MNNHVAQLAEQAGFIVVGHNIHFDEGNNTITSCPEAHALISLILSDIKDTLKKSLKHPPVMGNEWEHGYDSGVQSVIELINQRFNP